MVKFYETLACALLASGVLAHPGADIRQEVKERREALRLLGRRTLEDCKEELENSGYYKRELDRRLERVNTLRAEYGSAPLSKRDIDPYYAVDGKLGPRSLYDERATCITDPEVTEGPYWVSGELIVSDVRKGTTGVMTHLDINVIDVTTCKPIPNIYVELWGANSTGVYTGVVAKGNGVGLTAPEEINNNAGRGLQPTSANGTATFITVAPGHYVGRANHLHTIIHHGATVNPNNTISGGTISHVGQFYIQQDTLAKIEATNPYNTNTQAQTLNANDMLLRQGQGNGDNPYLQISMLGTKYEDGIYAFIDVGVNPSAKQNPKPVNTWTATGGKPFPGSPWAGYPWTKKIRSLLGI